MNSIKAQGLPVNTVIMVIIGLTIFGLGMGLFTSISNSGQDEIDKLNEQVRTGINSLECDGADWICSPARELKNGEGATFDLNIANKGEENQQFSIKFLGVDAGSEGEILKDGCGSVTLNYLNDLQVNILSGESATIPYYVKARNVEKIPCSFVATAQLFGEDGNTEIDRTSVIIKVK